MPKAWATCVICLFICTSTKSAAGSPACFAVDSEGTPGSRQVLLAGPCSGADCEAIDPPAELLFVGEGAPVEGKLDGKRVSHSLCGPARPEHATWARYTLVRPSTSIFSAAVDPRLGPLASLKVASRPALAAHKSFAEQLRRSSLGHAADASSREVSIVERDGGFWIAQETVERSAGTTKRGKAVPLVNLAACTIQQQPPFTRVSCQTQQLAFQELLLVHDALQGSGSGPSFIAFVSHDGRPGWLLNFCVDGQGCKIELTVASADGGTDRLAACHDAYVECEE